MNCPTCGAGGFISKKKIVDLGAELYTCGKCATCWTKSQTGLIKKFRSLASFLKENGFQYGGVEIEGIRMICQMCDGDGEINKIKIPSLGIKLRVCDKCDACWTSDQFITMKTSKKLSTFLKEHNLDSKDIELEGKVFLCPRCDGQGEVYRAKIIALGIELMVCDECESCWTQDQKITSRILKNLPTFLEEHGLGYMEAEIERDYSY